MNSITTSPYRVEHAGYWCEDATNITKAFIARYNKQWNDEIPIVYGLDPAKGFGLSNTLLALGAPHPRFSARASGIVNEYINTIFAIYYDCRIASQYVFWATSNLLTDANRAMARRAEFASWVARKQTERRKQNEMFCEGICILLSDAPTHIRALHATKQLLMFIEFTNGRLAASNTRAELIEWLRDNLNAGVAESVDAADLKSAG